MDPDRDIAHYMKEADALGLKIARVYLIHSHADFVAGLIQKLGFRQVLNMEGGSEAWIEAGLPTLGPTQTESAPSAGVFVNLPERVGARDLAQLVTDLPGSVDVVDIRPAPDFALFHLRGAVDGIDWRPTRPDEGSYAVRRIAC